ncbi:MAG: homogentisate 1,2-dioxygenase [Bacteroidia bacterium]|nr:homogentisate 1,2-dioxygenase [Bacteroidia bacterium]MCX7651586.1 homogentisate 1,2-dioxygenase [Bacteroidia bacterium]MDW8417238.1 homogentisate 1,2-dioxygenase [Bacteroidia bacterium]
MPHYVRLGQVPHKRHTQFRNNGKLFAEELISTEGFSDIYSLVYHVHPPTIVRAVEERTVDLRPRAAIENNMRHRAFRGFAVQPQEDYLESRTVVLFNEDVHLSLAAPKRGFSDYFYKNASADELIFVHEGTGELRTGFGIVRFQPGDYLHIPRGTIYQMRFDTPENRLFIIESYCGALRFPKRYMNEYGQLMEHSPFCERDIRPPTDLETHHETGEFVVKIKKRGELFTYILGTHPFDFVGWDGYLYPYAFSIHDFEPITGRVHQPPPVHQTYEARQFVVCSFVPRLYDYHPLAIPAPYNHSNVDSDEVLYYVEGEFMSRKHVERGMITLHPMGIPHGPHPGAVEKSIGAKETHELAVMVDTFRPLMLTQAALEIEASDYYLSWIPDTQKI